MHPSDSVENLIDKTVRLTDGQPITQIRAALGDLTGQDPDQVRAQLSAAGSARRRPTPT